MDFGRIQEAWTSQPDHPSGPNADLVRRIVERDRMLRRRVAIRDFIEMGVAICMASAFACRAAVAPVGWPWAVASGLMVLVAGAFVRERLRHQARAPHASDVRDGLEQAVAEADHQIRLLSTVLWWYLGPIALAVACIVLASVLGVRATASPAAWTALRARLAVAVTGTILVCVATFVAIWWANRRAARQQLQPHRDALVELLRHLSSDEEESPR